MSMALAGKKKVVMAAEFVDIANHPELTGHSTKAVLFSSDHYHVWVHIDEPGKKGPMHKHSADEIFYCVRGECTIHFPNGESEKLRAGMVVTLPKDQLYQLHNTGTERMILLGTRAEPAGKLRHTKDDKIITNIKGEYVVDAKA
jgi:mannose-6-phosphate isomerase-like protein (cupin superfamily)